LESRENRAGALEVIHRRILFWRQSSGAGLGREFMHPSHVVLAEGKPQNGTRHPRRQFLIGVKDAQPNLSFGLRCKRFRFHENDSRAQEGAASRERLPCWPDLARASKFSGGLACLPWNSSILRLPAASREGSRELLSAAASDGPSPADGLRRVADQRA